MRNSKGFTLVELAVVLVIIGIILGAVLKGGDLIDNAKEKQFKSEVSALTVAFYNYQDKYGRLPGDDDKASTRWTGASDGDKSGLIGFTAALAANTTETAPGTGALNHLRRAGLLTDQAVASTNPFASQVYNGVTMNFGAVTTTVFGKVTNLLIVTNMGKDDKIAYDAKYDDGDPAKGDVQSSDAAVYAAQDLWIRLR